MSRDGSLIRWITPTPQKRVHAPSLSLSPPCPPRHLALITTSLLVFMLCLFGQKSYLGLTTTTFLLAPGHQNSWSSPCPPPVLSEITLVPTFILTVCLITTIMVLVPRLFSLVLSETGAAPAPSQTLIPSVLTPAFSLLYCAITIATASALCRKCFNVTNCRVADEYYTERPATQHG